MERQLKGTLKSLGLLLVALLVGFLTLQGSKAQIGTGEEIVSAAAAAKKCTIYLDLNGGNGSSQFFGSFSRDQGSTYGSNLDHDPSPPSGKHFTGWYTAASGGNKVTSSSKVPNQTSITLYAHYASNSYTVNFNSNGGSGSMSSKTYYVGNSYSLPSNTFTRSGYSFAGWATSSGGSVQYSNGQTVSNLTYSNGGSVTLYAKWNRLSCTIHLNLNGGSGSSQYFDDFSRYQGDSMGDALNRDPAPPSGKHFVGWYNSSSGGSRYYSSSTVPYQSSFTLYAHYEWNTYTINFNANGGSGSGSMSCTYGSSYTLPSSGYSRTGYALSGWSDGSKTYSPGQSVSNLVYGNGGSITLYAQWRQLTCSVAFNVNGGNGQANMPNKSLAQGSKFGSNLYSAPGAPNANMHFVGWFTAASGGTQYTSDSTVPYSSSLTLYAHWDTNKYTIAFNPNASGVSGSMSSMSCVAGNSYNLNPNRYSLTGYTFAGWNTKSNGSGASYGDGAKVTSLTTANGGVVTLYAQWKVAYCNVAFNVNGGNGQANMPNKSLQQGSRFGSNLYSAPGAPDANKHFVGWFTAASGGTQYTSDSTVPYSSSLTLYAHWDTNKYTIAFSPNASGVTGSMNSMSCLAGNTYNLTANSYSLIGYTFAGWNTKANGSGTSYANGAKINTLTSTNGAVVTLYAQWSPSYCKITFDVNGGNGQANMSAQSVQQGTTIGSKLYSAPGAPTHKHFVGWFDAKSGGTQYTSSSRAPYSSTLTLYARWEQDAYTIAFNNNATGVSGTMNPMTKCLVDSSYKLTGNTLSRKGYSFNGWNTKSDGSGKTYTDGATVSNLTTTNGATVTLYAQWKVLYCSIKFDVNGGNGQANMSAQSVPQGATIGSKLYSAPGAPTHKHFVGWFDAKSGGTQYTSNSQAPYSTSLTLYAHWEQDAYTIAFNNNATGVSGTMNPMTKCLVDSSYKLTGNTLSRKGYSFNGWNTKSDGSGKTYTDGATVSNLTTTNGATVTLYAQWKVLYCSIKFDVNGGNGQANMSAQSVPQGATIGSKLYSAPGAPTHKHFVGWFDAKSGGTQYTSNSQAPYSSSLTLYAHWEQDAYTIAFNNNATGVTGTMNPMTKCLVDSSYKLTGNTLSRKGYSFNGWNTKSDGSGKAYADGATVSNLTTKNGATVTLFAQWKVLYCSIKFDVNGGNGQANMPAQSVQQGATIGSKLYSAPGAPAHKHFVGWFNATSGGTQYTSNSQAPYSSSLTLYARWEWDKYTIVFAGNGNTSGSVSSMVCVYNTSYTLNSNNFVRRGYSFAGWNTKKDGSGTKYANGAKVSNLVGTNNGTITLYAQWEPLYCTIKFDANGGGGQQYLTNLRLQQGTSLQGKLYSQPSAPATRHFDGWFTAPTGGKRYTTSDIVPYVSDLTLYAHWAYNSYRVEFDGNTSTSGSMQPMVCYCGSTYSLSSNGFVKKGYEFVSWNTKKDGTGKSYADKANIKDLVSTDGGSIKLYAQWKLLNCVISFDVNGGNGQQYMTTVTVLQGASLKGKLMSAPGAPANKHFTGWYSAAVGGTKYTDASQAPYVSSLKLYAHWEDNRYSIVFAGNGNDYGSTASMSCACGTSYTLTSNGFIKRGYQFTGWNTKADGSGKSYANNASVKDLVATNGGTITLYAQWKIQMCVISFDVNGGNGQQYMANVSVQQGASLKGKLYSSPGAPKNMHFVGWYTAKVGGTMYTENMTAPNSSTLKLYARWAADTYTIIFTGNKETSGSMIPMTCEIGKSYRLSSNQYAKQGYSFDGWNTKADGTGKKYANNELVTDLAVINGKTVTLYAQWKALNCVITFNVNGGNGQQYMGNKTVQQGASLNGVLYTSPGAPQYKHFVGWFDKQVGGTQYTNASKAPFSSSITLYAHWEYNRYTIIFAGNKETGGSMTPMTCVCGTEYQLAGNGFRKDGYTFTGWNTKADGSGTAYKNAIKFTNLVTTNGGTLTLYAQWKLSQCVITFDVNGGDGQQFMGNKTVLQGASLKGVLYSAPGAPEYKHFDGWYSAKTGGKKYTEDDKAPHQEKLTLYARWADNTYTIVFEGNGNENGIMKNVQAKCNEPVVLPANSYVKTEYTFTGWNTKADGTGNTYKNKATVNNLVDKYAKNGTIVHLYAQWKRTEYLISFDVNGGYGAQYISQANFYLHKGDKYPDMPSGPSNGTGYQFDGWYTEKVGGKKIEKGMVFDQSEDQTLYAHYSKIEYIVRFDVRGGNGKQYIENEKITVRYGEAYGKLPGKTTHPNGLRFGGWETEQGQLVTETTLVSIAANHTLYARWEDPKTYIIRFDGNGNIGGRMDSLEVNYDESAKLPKVAFDDGVGFDCWSTKPDGTGEVFANGAEVYNLIPRTEKEIVLYAIWKQGYTVKYHDGLTRNVIKTVTGVPHKYVCDYRGPEITGLKFVGWMTLDYADYLIDSPYVNLRFGNSYLVNDNIDFYPVYSPVTKEDAVEVIYFMNGAKGSTIVEYQYAKSGKDTVMVKPNQVIPERADGREFAGWSLYSVDWQDLFGPGEEITNYYVGEVVTLYAQWADYECVLTFDYNYPGGESKTYTGGQYDIFFAPKPKRDGYKFLGWAKSTSGTVVYDGDDEVTVPYGGLTLYAQWKPKTYTVEYYSSKTCELIYSEQLDSTQCLADIAVDVPAGMVFTGWELAPQGSVYEYSTAVYGPCAKMSDILDDVMLYTSFRLADDAYQEGKITVIYDLQKGYDGPPYTFVDLSEVDGISVDVKTSAKAPSRTGCDFAGWSTRPDNDPECNRGGTLTCPLGLSNVVFVYACWTTKYTITLKLNADDPDCSTKEVIIDDKLPGDLLDLSKYKNKFKRDSEYLLYGWGLNKDTFTYAKEESILIPAENLTLYAIWHEKQYSISYYDGTSGKRLWEDQLVTKNAKITDQRPERTGQDFIGWRYATTDYWLIDFVPEQEFTATENIILYSVFEESNKGIPDGYFAVIFEETLGNGGPGRVLYPVGKKAFAPTVEPTSNDYDFLGWCYEGDISNAINFEPGDEIPFIVKEGQSRVVHAVWSQKINNPVKENLQNTYGTSSAAMKNDHFDDDYLSSAWEQINPYAWCVIRTVNENGSKLKNKMKTTAMVMEYKLNGEWILDCYGNGMREGIWDFIKHEIYCSNTNFGGAFANFLLTASKTAASIVIPGFGVIMTVTDIADGVIKVMASKPEEYEETKKIIAETVGVGVDAIGQKTVEEFLNKVGKAGAESGTKLLNCISVFQSAVEYLVETGSLASYKDDPFGDYDVAIGTFKERMKTYGFEAFVSGVPNVITQIYKNVNYNDLSD